MNENIQLQYAGKRPDNTVIEGVCAAQLTSLFDGISNQRRLGESASHNLLIFGENLSVMRTLLEDSAIRGHVRLVYIDPPFAAQTQWRGGNGRVSTISSSDSDDVAYDDRLTGPEYLEFLRQRLIFLRELLSATGSIYVHIDWKMGHYVKILMDEVFGANHFINDIARVKCNPKNFERKGYGNVKDMILFYSKTDRFVWNGAAEPYTEEEIRRLFPKIDEQGRRYTTNPLHAPGETKNGETGKSWRGQPPPRGRHWRYPPAELETLEQDGLIEWSRTGNPRKKIYADEFALKQKKAQDIWIFKDPQRPSYPTQKSQDLLDRIVRASSNPGDIVLDCFCGSGTALVSAERFKRRWIGIDNSPLAIQAAVSRLTKIRKPAPFKILMQADLPREPLLSRLESVVA